MYLSFFINFILQYTQSSYNEDIKLTRKKMIKSIQLHWLLILTYCRLFQMIKERGSRDNLWDIQWDIQ